MSKVLVDRGLLPCPFCGQQDAFVEQLDSDASMVICQGMVDEHSACLARGPVGVQQSDMEDQPGRNAAIANWNRRAQPAEAGGVDRWLHQEGEHHQHPDGEWMLYADHIAALSAERTRADVAVADANDAERALAAVTAERDRLQKKWARVESERDQLRTQLRTEVERYVPLHEAVQRAAGELPEGWAIQLYIERDGGGVELIGPAGTEDFATNNERLDYTVIDALEAAMAAKEA